MLSREGGVEIETVADENPDAIAKVWIDPVDGLSRDAAADWGRRRRPARPVRETVRSTCSPSSTPPTSQGDADLVEINPLILKPTGEVHALDAKVTLDANSTFRHEDYERYDETQVRDEREADAHAKGLQYVGLDGYVGVIANGAGLAMSTVDIVNQVGGRPANFLDIGGGANAEVMAGALETINNDANVEEHLHQHLRWHHQGRRGRQRHRRRARPGRHRRADRHPPRRGPTPRRAGRSSPATRATSW